ncbi:uncharacterized protein METZ01_LOCUS484202, partial [marine metagenome]
VKLSHVRQGKDGYLLRLLSKAAASQSQKEDDRFVDTTLAFLQILHKPTGGIKPTW